jgi:hypothetical protein
MKWRLFIGSGYSVRNCWRSRRKSAAHGLSPILSRRRKKTTGAIQQEVAREVSQLLRVIFNGRRQSGRLDLEATEMVVRSVMHQAGASDSTGRAVYVLMDGRTSRP